MANKRIAGVLTASINGQIYDVGDKVMYSPASVKREPLIGLSGYTGLYKETPVNASITMTLRDVGNPIKLFETFTSATIVINLANGKTVTGVNMIFGEPVQSEAGEATFDVMFFGKTVIES